MHCPRNGTSPDTILRHSATSPDTIRRPNTTTLAAHTLAQDRATAVVAHTRRAAAADIHRTAAEGRHPTAAGVHRLTVAGAVIATHTQAPVPTTKAAARILSLEFGRRNTERATDNQPSLFLLFKDERIVYQTPLSLPVILNATAAAEASGGNRLNRKVAGTFPLNAAWVICFV